MTRFITKCSCFIVSGLVALPARADGPQVVRLDAPGNTVVEAENEPIRAVRAEDAPVHTLTEVDDEASPPRQVGCVLELKEGRVVLSREPGERAAAGSSVAFHDVRGDEAVVGRIERVNNTTYWVTIRMNEGVQIGECAYATISRTSGSLLAPQPGSYSWALGASVKPWLGLDGDTSGFLFEGFGVLNVTERIRLRLALEPLAPPIGALPPEGTMGIVRRTPGAMESYLAVSANFHLMEVGFGVGAGTANGQPLSPPSIGVLFTPVLRIGAEDGLNVRLRSSAVVVHQPVFGSFRAELEIPVAYGVKLTHAGGGGSSGYYFFEIGVKKLMTGNGGAGTWISTVSLGHGGTRETRPSHGVIGADGPYMGLGVERRF